MSRDINRVIEETIHIANLFNLPVVEDAQEIIEEYMEKDQIAIVDKEHKVHPINIKTALNCGNIIGEKIDKTLNT